MAFTVQNICDEALRLIGVLRANASFSNAGLEYQTCIDALNQVVDSFSADGLTIYQMVRETFTLTGATSYTIGAGATFNTVRPEKIRAASTITGGGSSMPCKIVSAEKFSTIIDRTVTGQFVDFLCCDYDFPLSNLYVWPAPGAGTLELWSYKPLSSFVYLTDAVSFPPGYLEALKYNLAVAIFPEFPGARLDPTIPLKADRSKQRLGALNAVTIGMPAAPLSPVAMQQPLTEVDVEKGKVTE